MNALREKLKGWKTYIIAAGSILGTVVAWSTGDIELAKATELIVAAIMATTIRAGIGKAN